MSASDAEGRPAGHDDTTFLRKLLGGTAWQGAGLLFSNLASFATKLILARILAPEYFGLVGMAVVFTGLIQTIEKLGIVAALVQRKDEELSDVDLYTGHLGAILVGCIFYVAIIIPGAPAVAWFYEEPQLTAVIVVLAIPVIIDPFATYQKVKLNRELRFALLAKIEVFATFLGAGVAVVLALCGAGVWALVAQWVIFSIATVTTLRLLIASPQRTNFSFSSLRRTLGFGGYITGQRIFSFISKQSDYLIVGKLVGAASLGAYTIAFLLTDAIRGKLMAALTRVLFSAYSRIQTDLVALNRFYLGSIRFSTLAVSPILCALLFYPAEILRFGFGEEWLEAVVPLQLLAVAAWIHTIGGTNSTALKAVNRPDLAFKIRMFESLFVMIPALLVGVHYFGLAGAGAAVILGKLASRLSYHWCMRRIIGTREPDIARAIAPSLVATTAMALVLLELRSHWPVESLRQTVAFLIIATSVYTLVALPLVFGELRRLWQATRT